MLNNDLKKTALDIHKRTIEKYNKTVSDVQKKGELLYALRKESLIKIELSENLINSIAHTPKEICRKLVAIDTMRIKFRNTEEYAKEAYQVAIKSGTSIATGIAGGAAIASMAPTAAMWVATTFGTASTGTAISTLSGAVATKAALAWLGGGALSAGGAGMAGGQALLALAGPIGWGLAALAVGGNVVFNTGKNKKIADAAFAEAKTITFAGAQLNETAVQISHLSDETTLLMNALEEQLVELRSKGNMSYTELPYDEQLSLGTFVNNTLSLAEMLNKTIS